MTIKETLEKLKATAQEKQLLYLKTGQDLMRQKDGLLSKLQTDMFDQAREEWRLANSAYRTFLMRLGKEEGLT